jgi:hypothetical protein
VLLIMFHFDRNVMFSDRVLALFRFYDASMTFTLSFFLFGATCMCRFPCVLGLPSGVGQVVTGCGFVGGVGLFGKLG